QSVVAAAQAMGLDALHIEARTADEIDTAIGAALSAGANALHVNTDTLFGAATGLRRVHLALEDALPSMYSTTTFARVGGLTAYAPDIADMHRRASNHIVKLLDGADPALLPLDLAAAFEFLVNVQTARTLGLTIPPDVAVQVTEWVA